ncbi:hypothetical protein K3X48_01140 [Aliiroseovarius crassostreae]|uniref:Uncharacterized protein n=1 Tax=Aliiroseovarius crassostreae TaxID=154981 RepID=A0A9Q9LZJ6_9RHOB|nr:hypothetical protein [Aliiroseovarius crassostreae]UWP95644.1 hypothetical protein K3X48_01140 [Aliiroseovarius crassostreae]
MFSKFFFNRMPWWLFASVLLGAAPLSIGLLIKAVDAQLAMKDVQSQPPSETVLLRDFTSDQAVNAYGEIRIKGRYSGIENVIAKSKADIHYLLLVSEDGSGPGVIVQDLAIHRDEVLSQLAARLAPDQTLTVSGFVRSEISWEDLILRDLADKNISVPDQLYQLDVYWGGREDALRSFMIDQWGMAGVSLVMTIILGFATRWRYRVTRQKKLERKRRIEDAKEAAWDDSPIQTPKGWLG